MEKDHAGPMTDKLIAEKNGFLYCIRTVRKKVFATFCSHRMEAAALTEG